jgi:hypothetical protein
MASLEIGDLIEEQTLSKKDKRKYVILRMGVADSMGV